MFKPGKRNLKLPPFSFRLILRIELFENDDITITLGFPQLSFLQTQIQNDCNCCVLNFLWCSVDGKLRLMGFQRETSVFKFLRFSVDRISGTWSIAIPNTTDEMIVYRTLVTLSSYPYR